MRIGCNPAGLRKLTDTNTNKQYLHSIKQIIMKITISLSDNEKNGIKEYLIATGSHVSVNKTDIAAYIQNIVDCTINCPSEAVSDYISKQSL